jgi:hypothetical protein
MAAQPSEPEAVFTSEVLYQLSYVGESAVDGIGRTAASWVRPPST